MRRNTISAAAAVAIILVVAAFAGSKLNQSTSMSLKGQQVEPVSVMKKSVVRPIAAQAPLSVQPRLEMHYAPANAPAATPAPAPAPDSLSAPQIARTGKISLFVGSVDNAVSALTALAHREGGDVFSLQVDNASDSTSASAEMQVRIPAARFDDTMNAAATIGKVRERSVGAEDLTGDITDSSARLRNLRRTEADIRKIMDRSGTVGQVLDAENQLSQVREQIETLESDLKSMHGQVIYSTIDVSFEAEAAPAPVEPKAASQLATAWHAAVHALSQLTVGLIAALVWLLVFIPYLLLAFAVAYVLYTRLRKAATL